MKLNIGNRIIYEDKGGVFIKGEIADIMTHSDGEITGYFVKSDSGTYIHFHASSLRQCHLDKSVLVPKE